MMIATEVSHSLEMIFNFNISGPPRPTIFEIILISSVMTAVLALEILFLYVLFKKLVKSQVTLEGIKTTPLGVKISSILVMIIGGPFLIIGGYFIFAFYYILFITGQGFLAMLVFIFVFGAFFAGIGVVCLIMGVFILTFKNQPLKLKENESDIQFESKTSVEIIICPSCRFANREKSTSCSHCGSFFKNNREK